MKKFTKTLMGYNPREVNQFLDQTIVKLEEIIKELQDKEQKIVQLTKELEQLQQFKENFSEYNHMKNSLEQSLDLASKNAQIIAEGAHKEHDRIVDSAKKNANIIVNNALIRSEQIEKEALDLKQNMSIYKKRIKGIIEAQLKLVEELDEIDM